jgi:hypothetical protein
MSISINKNINSVVIAQPAASLIITDNRKGTTVTVSRTPDIITVTNLSGLQGPKGDTGPQGPAGSDTSQTGSFFISASVANAVITFTKGDASTSSVTVNNVVSASYAQTASYYAETDPIFVAKSGSFATTGSNIFKGNQTISGSIYLNSGSVINSTGADIIIKAGVGFNAGVVLYNNSFTQYLAVDDTASYANKFTVANNLTVLGLTTTQNQQISGSVSQGLGIASGEYSHAEGSITKAIGDFSHAEGDNTQAVGNYSHAEGQETIASGSYSHAEGFGTIALGDRQHVTGQYNFVSPVQSAFIVGNGTDNNNRSNLIYAAGNEVQISGSVTAPSFTGSLFGTATNALSSSYALTASYALNGSGLGFPFSGSAVITGSLEIKSNVNNIFIIKNFDNQHILTVSQSGVIVIATQSIDPIGTAPNGAIYFTSSSFFIGLD